MLKRNKFNAVKTTYKGIKYDSKMEAKYAKLLDLLVKSGEVENVERQHKIELIVNGKKICNYIIDFKVYYSDGNVEYHEVKGVETALFKLKWKLSKVLYPDYKFVLIKKV